nr:hypothetical protein [Actinomyces bowdenii]
MEVGRRKLLGGQQALGLGVDGSWGQGGARKPLRIQAKREGRSALAGLIAARVVDTDKGQVGVLVEINAETDFVAKNQKFLDYAEQVLTAALDSGAQDAEALAGVEVEGSSVKDLTDGMQAVIGEKEETTRAEGKPEKAIPKIVEGRLGGFFKENVLVEQAFAKDPKTTVGKVVEATGGELIGFVRFRVGA